MRQRFEGLIKTVPILASAALVLAACGGGGSGPSAAQQVPAAASATEAKALSTVKPAASPAVAGQSNKAAPTADAGLHEAGSAKSRPAEKVKASAPDPAAAAAASAVESDAKSANTTSAGRSDAKAANSKSAEQMGASDVGVTAESIKLGSFNMHGMALGNILVGPIVRAVAASMQAVNDRGGVLGRRLKFVDCDDGPGEVSRSKACIKKLVGQDKIFSLITGASWGTASVHDDLKQYKIPYLGSWGYSQTEWQDPYMFPLHMSMIHEAMAGAHWVTQVIRPKTYALFCLSSPEMQLACDQVSKIMDAAGSKLVKKVDVAISETSMSAAVVAMRAANPEHIIHYVVNPATIAKFIVEAAQQQYYPPKGISGNHLAAEVLGSLFGKWPAGRYWTNTTFKLWGSEYMATMTKYATGNRGVNHHITQASYEAVNFFASAGKEIGPNLTRERLMAVLANHVWKTDASLDQKFSWVPSERYGSSWSAEYAQGREFMYEYTSENTVGNPDGSPSGFTPDKDKFVISTYDD